MKKLNSAFLLIGLILSAHSYSQGAQFIVKKSNATFTYNNKLIRPETILPFLPDMESDDTIRPWVVNLKDSSNKREAKLDTISNTSAFAYIDYGGFQQGYISYKVVAKTNDNKFIVLVYWNGGGTLTFPFVFVFRVTDEKLYRLGNFLAEPLYINPDETIEVKGNEIINGEIHYTIPN